VLSVKTIEPKDDGMWDLKQLEAQTKEMLSEFERIHPGCIAVVLLDNSTIHARRVRRQQRAGLPSDSQSRSQMTLSSSPRWRSDPAGSRARSCGMRRTQAKLSP
jgi:hypothetical protein